MQHTDRFLLREFLAEYTFLRTISYAIISNILTATFSAENIFIHELLPFYFLHNSFLYQASQHRYFSQNKVSHTFYSYHRVTSENPLYWKYNFLPCMESKLRVYPDSYSAVRGVRVIVSRILPLLAPHSAENRCFFVHAFYSVVVLGPHAKFGKELSINDEYFFRQTVKQTNLHSYM